MNCSHCLLPIHPSDHVEHRGMHVSHDRVGCVRALRAQIEAAKSKLRTLEQNYDLCKAELAGVIEDAKAQALRLDAAQEEARLHLSAYETAHAAHFAAHQRALDAERRLDDCIGVLRPIAVALDQGICIEPGSFSHDEAKRLTAGVVEKHVPMYDELGRYMNFYDDPEFKKPSEVKRGSLSDRLRDAGFSPNGEGDTISRKWSGP